MINRSRRELITSVLGAAGSAAGVGSAWSQNNVPRASPWSITSWPLNTEVRTGIHDVAPAPDGGVWFSAQRSGHLGWFDPRSGKTELIALGSGSSPHGVIQGPDGAAWLTDGGQNAIARVAWPSREVKLFRLPAGTPYANLNTCAFDGDGNLWFTGQSGYVGKVTVASGAVSVEEAPNGRGPYGICATPKGDVWYCSLAGSFIAKIDRRTGKSQVFEPPTARQGARRVWSDSSGRIWVSEWNGGNLSMFDPAASRWRTFKVPVESPQPYSVYVDNKDIVWVSEWRHNVMARFDPATEKFDLINMPKSGAYVRQMLGRPGEVWLPESGNEAISVIRTV
jgi:virginiamycin B lyase